MRSYGTIGPFSVGVEIDTPAEDVPVRGRMTAPPIGNYDANYERDACGGITTRGEFEAPVKETPLPPSEGLASRRRIGY